MCHCGRVLSGHLECFKFGLVTTQLVGLGNETVKNLSPGMVFLTRLTMTNKPGHWHLISLVPMLSHSSYTHQITSRSGVQRTIRFPTKIALLMLPMLQNHAFQCNQGHWDIHQNVMTLLSPWIYWKMIVQSWTEAGFTCHLDWHVNWSSMEPILGLREDFILMLSFSTGHWDHSVWQTLPEAKTSDHVSKLF